MKKRETEITGENKKGKRKGKKNKKGKEKENQNWWENELKGYFFYFLKWIIFETIKNGRLDLQFYGDFVLFNQFSLDSYS